MNNVNFPEHWKMIPLEKAVNVFDKKRIPLNETQRQQMPGEYPYCGANGVVDYVNDYLFDGEHVLLAEDGGYWGSFENSAYLMNGKFWVNNHAHVLQAKQGLSDNYFLMCQLNYLDIKPFISGTTRGKLNQGMMKRVPLSLPTLPEQRAIAYILQTIQEAKSTRQHEIVLERERKAALMDFLFSHGTKDEPRKQTEIGEIPESWEMTKLGDLVKLKSGETRPKDIESKPDAERTIPVYGGNGILGYTGKQFSDQRLLVIGRVGAYCGCVHIAEAPNWITDNALYSEKWFSNEVSLDFLAEQLEHFNLNQLQRRGGQPLITQSILHQLKVPLPPFPEQYAIAETFSAFDEKIAVLEQEVELIDELFHAMLEGLMTGQRSAVPLLESGEIQ
ncbi:MAG: restriction endonuclease subunit S [Candidatus Poribacteria bacterium]|nr:restriction endonuclease subunit S [Candidatus Poribacteria bacterium]